jgi:mRNA-degrading endonuclease toxin of MazEF toxin-antitoxin module
MVFWGEVLEREHRDAEQYHDSSNPCPWVVVSADILHRRLPLVVAVPLTSKLHKDNDPVFRRYRIRVLSADVQRYTLQPGERGLNGDSLALTEQVRSMAHARLLGNPIAYLDGRILGALEAGAKEVLAFK